MIKQIELADLLAKQQHDKFFDADELLQLQEKMGPIDFYHARMNIQKEYFDRWFTILYVKKNRRAEIALSITNPKKQILLHTKPFYPPDVYRIPTGGIHPDEKVLDALHRELDEETGFAALSFQPLALLLYEFIFNGQSIVFSSFIFTVDVENNEPHPKDESENITGFQWIDADTLPDVFHQLEGLPGKWRDWGVMRALPHKIIYDSLS